MAVRTTSAAVEGILEESPSLTLTPFIETGSYLVDKCCADVTNPDGSAFYDATALELIERWLSAHFYHVAATRANAEKAGSVGETKRSKVDLKLNLTHYGGQAMLLDVAGGLASLNKTGINTISAGVDWLGTPDEEEDS
jgi:hypothetical protein